MSSHFVEMHLISASRLFNDYNVTCLDIQAHVQLQIIMGTIVFTIISGWMLSVVKVLGKPITPCEAQEKYTS